MAVTTAVPVNKSGLRVTKAFPSASVVAIEELSVPRLVSKLTGVLTATRPMASRTLTFIVDAMVDPAARIVGLAVISIKGSVSITASKGIVCP